MAQDGPRWPEMALGTSLGIILGRIGEHFVTNFYVFGDEFGTEKRKTLEQHRKNTTTKIQHKKQKQTKTSTKQKYKYSHFQT